jgi:hypothetical protein
MALHPKYRFITILKIFIKSKNLLNHISQSKPLLHFKGLYEYSKPSLNNCRIKQQLLSVIYLFIMFFDVSNWPIDGRSSRIIL